MLSRECSADAQITKPFDMKELLGVVSKFLKE
jgi:DNA-binding response OmpR family regulator